MRIIRSVIPEGRKEKEMDRKGFIGGSDISAVVGMSRWKTPLKLWSEKVGIMEPDDLSDVEAVEWGHDLEDLVAKKFEKKTGLKVRRPPVTHYTHQKYSWARAQIDRLIEGTDELLEVKTCSAFKLKEWDGESIPQEYILQVYWQMLITGRRKAWIAVLIGGQKFLYKCVDADDEFQKKLLNDAISFWDMVCTMKAPSAIYGDDDALLALHPKANDQIQAVQEMETAVARRQELSQQIKDMKAEQEEIEVKIKECIGDNLGLKTQKYLVRWTPTKTNRVDTEKMKSAGVYDQYLKESESRRLTIKLNKPEGTKEV